MWTGIGSVEKEKIKFKSRQRYWLSEKNLELRVIRNEIILPAHEKSRACRDFPARIQRMAARGRIPGLPQAAGEHPCGWVLGTRTAKI